MKLEGNPRPGPKGRAKKALVLVSLLSMFALGCELIVDFDRSKIPVEEVPETGIGDATPADDTGVPGEAGPDASEDASEDGTTGPADAESDAGSDADADA